MMVEKKNTGRLPEFFLIGAAKSGTSSLFGYLIRHPKIFIPEIKETEYFSQKSIFSRGEEWYRHLFLEAKKSQLCGDASTTYSRWPHTLDAARLIAKSVPDAKLIYIMRHPVDRTYSHYAHHMRLGITMSFEEALEKDDIYIDCSMYMPQIERYLKYFSKESFIFLFQNDLWDNPRKVIENITEFLDIRMAGFEKEDVVRKNVSGPDHFIRSKTTERLRKMPGMGFVARLLPEGMKNNMYRFLKHSSVGRRLEAQHQLVPMKPETREHLINIFETPNKKLEEFLGVELPTWRI